MPTSQWIGDVHWVRTSQQTRAEQTQAKLLDAAEELFGDNGVTGTSVADIAARAGCSIGAVYHHFSDKKAVLFALSDRIYDEYVATATLALDPSRWVGAAVGDILFGFLELSLGTSRTRPSSRLPGVEIARSDPALAAQYDRMLIMSDLGLTKLFLERRDEIGHPDPELAVKYVLEQLGSMLRRRLARDSLPTRFGDISDDVFIAETARSFCSYLQVDLPAGL